MAHWRLGSGREISIGNELNRRRYCPWVVQRGSVIVPLPRV